MKLADTAMRFWGMRSGKERMALCAAGGVAAAATLYVLLLEPAITAGARLSTTLPRLRAQAEDMRQQQKEIAVLRKKIAAASQYTDLKSVLQSSAARTSFANSIERIEAVSGEGVQILAAPVIFDDWLGWIEILQREFGIRLDGCKINATDKPGLVRVEATFASGGPPAGRKTP